MNTVIITENEKGFLPIIIVIKDNHFSANSWRTYDLVGVQIYNFNIYMTFHKKELSCKDVKKEPFSVGRDKNTLQKDTHLPLKIVLWVYIFANPCTQAGYDTRSIFKRSLTGLNSEISFS